MVTARDVMQIGVASVALGYGIFLAVFATIPSEQQLAHQPEPSPAESHRTTATAFSAELRREFDVFSSVAFHDKVAVVDVQMSGDLCQDAAVLSEHALRSLSAPGWEGTHVRLSLMSSASTLSVAGAQPGDVDRVRAAIGVACAAPGTFYIGVSGSQVEIGEPEGRDLSAALVAEGLRPVHRPAAPVIP